MREENAINLKSRLSKKIISIAAAAAMGLSAVTTSGFVPWADPMPIKAAAGDVYYDMGTVTVAQTTGGAQANAWTSSLSATEQAAKKFGSVNATIHDTYTGTNDALVVVDSDVSGKNGQFCYVAKGVESVNGAGESYITWSVKAWPDGQNNVWAANYANTTRANAETEWTNAESATLVDSLYETAAVGWLDPGGEDPYNGGTAGESAQKFLHVTTLPYLAADDPMISGTVTGQGGNIYSVMQPSDDSQIWRNLQVSSAAPLTNPIAYFAQDYVSSFGNQAFTFPELLATLQTKHATTYGNELVGPYKYKVSDTVQRTDYPTYYIMDYADYYWGTEYYPQLIEMLRPQNVTGVKLFGMYVNGELNGVIADKEYEDVNGASAYELPDYASGLDPYAFNGTTTPFVLDCDYMNTSATAGVKFSIYDGLYGNAPISETQRFALNNYEMAVARGLNYTSTAGPSTADITNTRGQFEYDFYVYYGYTDDFTRYTATLTTSPTDTREPEIVSTAATNKKDATKNVPAKANVTVRDAVNLTGLTVGKTYKLVTSLRNATSGAEITLTAGSTTYVDATAATMNNVYTDITFDASTIPVGTVLTVCQYLYDGTTLKDEHATLSEATEQITIVEGPVVPDPDITRTVATAADGTSKEITASATSKIKDVIYFSDLDLANDYTITTIVVDKANPTGTPLATLADQTFVPSAATATTPVEITVDTSAFATTGGNIVVYEIIKNKATGAVVASHEDPTDASQTVKVNAGPVVPDPEITKTVAVNGTNELSKEIPASATATIKDTIYYANLDTTKSYTLTTIVVDKDNSTTPLKTIADQAFIALAATSTTSVNIPIDTTALAGKSLVVYEIIKDATGTVVAEHKDPNDANQTVTVKAAEVEKKITATYAKNSNDGTSIVPAAKSVSITDTIYYTGLTAGTTYYVQTQVVEKSSGATMYINGAGLRSTFVADATGKTNVTFTMDTSSCAGKKLVLLEFIYDSQNSTVVLAQHNDTTDINQTLTVKSGDTDNAIRSTIASGDSTYNQNDTFYGQYGYTNTYYSGYYSHYLSVSEKAVITDRVYYEGLTDGETYTLTPSLYDAWSGTAIPVNVMPITFVANSRRGYVDVQIPVNTTNYAGRTLVVFESISHYDTDTRKQVEVGYHKDLNDTDQMIYVANTRKQSAQITSTVATGANGSKTLEYSANAVITDRVYYTGLDSYQTYTMQTSVIDVVTGATVATKSTTFNANTSNYIDITIPLNSTPYENQKLVVYESIFSGLNELCYHKDRYDASQTVTVSPRPGGDPYIPPTTTTTTYDIPVIDIPTGVSNTSEAVDSINLSHTMTFSRNANILNIVRYTGLVNGRTYTVVSTAYDKSTGMQSFGPVSKTFIADSTNKVENLIPMDSTLYEGKSFVVFASILENGVEISSYKNINDPEATVTVATVATILTSENRTSKTVAASNYTSLVDTVRYTGLTPGRTYKVTGYILNKEENVGKSCSSCDLLINGNEGSLVTNGIKIIDTTVYEFTATAASGSVDIIFNVNTAKYTGQHLVAFEIIQDKQYSTIVGEHKDVNDANQTVIVKTTTNVYTGGEDMTMPFAIGAGACIFAAAGFGAYVLVKKRRTNH